MLLWILKTMVSMKLFVLTYRRTEFIRKLLEKGIFVSPNERYIKIMLIPEMILLESRNKRVINVPFAIIAMA